MELKINNLSVYVEGNSSNKAIMFVHGFPYDFSMWNKVIEELKEDFYCVTFDIRGLGKSDPQGGQNTLESFVDDLLCIVDFLKLKKPVLCGLSMGGYISLRTIEREETKFSALILCDTKAEADTNEVKIRRAAGIKKIDNEGLEYFVKEFVPTCFSKAFINNNKDEFEIILNRCKDSNPVGVKGCLLAMAGRTDTTAYLSKIEIPVLVICGEDDKLSPPDSMQKMAEKIKHGKFAVIPDAGHMTPIETPEDFCGLVKEFLK